MTATQAPTPGPLTDGWKQAKGSNPFPHGDDTPIRVRRDGEEWDAKASTFNWDLWVEWRPLAPTAPVEASGSERETALSILQAAVRSFDSGDTTHLSGVLDDILDALRPQPSGETREAVLLKQLREAVRDYWQGRGAQAACGYAKWAAVCDALQAYDRAALSTTLARAEAQDEGAAGEIGAAIQRVEAVSLGGDVLDVYGAESFAHPTHTFRGDLRALLARAHPSPTPAADDDTNALREQLAEEIVKRQAAEEERDDAHAEIAADADRVRIAVEALEQISKRLDQLYEGSRKLRANDARAVKRIADVADEALAALKSEGK